MLSVNNKWKAIGTMVLCLCLSQISFGQQTWERVYGGTQNEVANSVQQTTDGGYIVGGGYDLCLVKLTANGDTSWTKKHDDVGLFEINSLQQTTDGGYVFSRVHNIRIWRFNTTDCFI